MIMTVVSSPKHLHKDMQHSVHTFVKTRVSFFVATTDVNQLLLSIIMPKANDILECGFLDRRLNRIIILMAATLVLLAIIAIGIVSNMGLENATGSSKICKRLVWSSKYKYNTIINSQIYACSAGQFSNPSGMGGYRRYSWWQIFETAIIQKEWQ